MSSTKDKPIAWVWQFDDGQFSEPCSTREDCELGYSIHAGQAVPLVVMRQPSVSQEAVLWVSPGQLVHHKDPEYPTDTGRYLPCQKTPGGLFTQPLYAAPLESSEVENLRQQIAQKDAEIERLTALISKPNNWIEWHGGMCPVAFDTVVEIRSRNGFQSKGRAGTFGWKHNYFPYDIVAYRTI